MGIGNAFGKITGSTGLQNARNALKETFQTELKTTNAETVATLAQEGGRNGKVYDKAWKEITPEAAAGMEASELRFRDGRKFEKLSTADTDKLAEGEGQLLKDFSDKYGALKQSDFGAVGAIKAHKAATAATVGGAAAIGWLATGPHGAEENPAAAEPAAAEAAPAEAAPAQGAPVDPSAVAAQDPNALAAMLGAQGGVADASALGGIPADASGLAGGIPADASGLAGGIPAGVSGLEGGIPAGVSGLEGGIPAGVSGLGGGQADLSGLSGQGAALDPRATDTTGLINGLGAGLGQGAGLDPRATDTTDLINGQGAGQQTSAA